MQPIQQKEHEHNQNQSDVFNNRVIHRSNAHKINNRDKIQNKYSRT